MKCQFEDCQNEATKTIDQEGEVLTQLQICDSCYINLYGDDEKYEYERENDICPECHKPFNSEYHTSDECVKINEYGEDR